MANALYDKARESFLKGDINWLTDTIKVVLVDISVPGHEYDVDTANHQFLSAVPSEARKATNTLQNKTVTNGVADADDVTFSSVSAGGGCEALIFYKDNGGNPATSPLIAYIDSGAGLPVTPDGSDILIQWSNAYNKIFRL